MTITFVINDMRQNVQTMLDIIISRFKKKITSTGDKFVWNVVFKLIHPKKAHFVHNKGAIKNIDVKHTDATAKIKQSKLDTRST